MIIAEFCQNHNGSFDEILRMLEAVAETGADAVKLQHIFAEDLSYRAAFEEGLVEGEITRAIKRPYKAEYDRLKGLEIKNEDVARFIEAARSFNLIPLTTCFSHSRIDEIKTLGFEAIKVASYDCGSFPFIRRLVGKFRTVIVSTGASYDDEIIKTANILANSNLDYYAMLHCVTIYPTPVDEAHINRLNFLKKHCPCVGYSDHSKPDDVGLEPTLVAIYCGAKVVERHFSISSKKSTRDGPVSVNEAELKEIVKFSKLSKEEQLEKLQLDYPNWKRCLGNETRNLSAAELLNRDYYRGRFVSKISERTVFNWEEFSTKV